MPAFAGMTAMTKVKICGITNTEDAKWAANLGADFIGLNFCKESPRKISIENAAEIATSLPPFVKAVGVVMDAPIEDIEKILKKVSVSGLQFHGSETPEDIQAVKSKFRVFLWKALKVENEESLDAIAAFAGIADGILLDACKPGQAGGTGETFDWALAAKAKLAGIPIYLAGGLNADNVKDAILQAGPQGVDVAGGVEKDGHPRRKDVEKMKAFILRAKTK